MTSDALWAPVKWAQRKDSIYVTVDLPDVKDEKVILTNNSLKFTGTSQQQKYEVNLEFMHEVDTEAKESKWAANARNVHFYIMKKDKEAEFWPHLLKDKTLEKTNVKVDWNKYVDEDEDDDSGFDMSALSGGGGFDINQMMAQQNAQMPGNVDEEDSDDEDLPDLED
jgi:prostaglandin-E synthase